MPKPIKVYCDFKFAVNNLYYYYGFLKTEVINFIIDKSNQRKSHQRLH